MQENIEVSIEQQKRESLLKEYQEVTQSDRETLNESVDSFQEKWKEKWLKLQSEIDQARATKAEQLEKEGVASEVRGGLLAMESAKIIEKFDAEKDLDAREIDKSLVKPKLWLDFLKEKQKETPEDPTFASLIEEAEKAPNHGIEGLEGTPSRVIALENLTHKINDKDGAIEYSRMSKVVIRDVGDRLDIKKSDDKDIEAALKIAAQKFNVENGLMLTGDVAFKARTAEIAGRLGLPLQNTEPEVLKAWERGNDLNKQLERAKVPSIERGITGELATPKALAELDGPVLLKAGYLTIENADKLNLVPNGEGVVSMSSDRVLKANALMREMPVEALRTIGTADLSKTDGGFSDEEKKQLTEYGLMDNLGNLTDEAKDVIVVRDDRVKKTRDIMGEATVKMFGKYQTSTEAVIEKTGKELVINHEADAAKERNEAAKEAKKEKDQEQENDDPFGDNIKEELAEQAMTVIEKVKDDAQPQLESSKPQSKQRPVAEMSM